MTATETAIIGEVSRQIGWQAAVATIIDAGNDIAKAAAPFWRHPRHVELEARRVPDHQPCPARCDRCSRCIHARAWLARGCRPYLGVRGEQHLGGQQEQHHGDDGVGHHGDGR